MKKITEEVIVWCWRFCSSVVEVSVLLGCGAT